MRLRQVIPTKFATAYRYDVDENGENGAPLFVTWWMWAGRCFKINRTVV